MTTYFTPTAYSPGRWLFTLAISLVFWTIAYLNAPAPAWQLGLQAPAAKPISQPSYTAASHLRGGRSRFRKALINDLDNALALRQLQGAYLAESQPAAQNREQNTQTVAANIGLRATPAARPTSPALGQLLAE